MLSIAIALAISFWTPYSPEPVCPQGVHVIRFTPGKSYAYPWGVKTKLDWDMIGFSAIGDRSCIVWLTREKLSLPMTCAVIAHELGHTWFDLEHSADPNNIMYPTILIPRGCK